MLEATPTNFFSTTFLLQDAGRIVGEIDASLFTQKAQLELADGGYDLYREGLIGDFVLALNGKVIARAAKPSVFENRFEVTVHAEIEHRASIRLAAVHPDIPLLARVPDLEEAERGGVLVSVFRIQ